MLNFLKKSRNFVNATTDKICIVLGNESCDLDSAVSALSLAFFFQQHQQHATTTKAKCFLPVLNIPRRDYTLKTEVQFLFNANSILPEEHLTFSDELKEDFIARSDFILVDHHVSRFAAYCVEVFDHRPYDAAANLPENCKINMELCGSCATLIAELILKLNDKEISSVADLLSLLRSTIILDTVNFSAAAARATPKDHEVCAALEKILAKTTTTLAPREQIFEALRNARADISTLTPLQLLNKDMKILSNADGSIKIALPGFPLLVQEFIKKAGAASAVREFAKDFDCAVVLLIGMFVCEADNSVQRDIGLINISRPEMCTAIVEQLLAYDNPALCLQAYDACNFMEGTFFKQNNIKATRKVILPIVKSVLEAQQTC